MSEYSRMASFVIGVLSQRAQGKNSLLMGKYIFPIKISLKDSVTRTVSVFLIELGSYHFHLLSIKFEL